MDSTWVTTFINDVNQARTSQDHSPLVLEDNLSTFAEFRAPNLTSHYDVPQYAFKNDSSRFFGPSGSSIHEATTYPEGFTPGFIASYLNQTVPILWQALLTNGTYGYTITHGPYYLITNKCDVTSIPRTVTNSTQYLESKACTFTIESRVFG